MCGFSKIINVDTFPCNIFPYNIFPCIIFHFRSAMTLFSGYVSLHKQNLIYLMLTNSQTPRQAKHIYIKICEVFVCSNNLTPKLPKTNFSPLCANRMGLTPNLNKLFKCKTSLFFFIQFLLFFEKSYN